MAFSQLSQPIHHNGMREASVGRPIKDNSHRMNNGTARKHRHEDEEQGKLFVGGLSWDTSQDSLLRYFSRFGEVIDCVVMKNPETARSRGFGFVTFSDPNNVDAVLASCPHSLDGRTIDPKSCNPRSMQKPKRTAATFLPKVFLGGLPSSMTETDLRGFFTAYGEVCEVVIMYDQEKKKSRGFGFLSFADDAACCRAVSEHYVTLQNKKVEIKRAEPRINHSDIKEGWQHTNGHHHTLLQAQSPPMAPPPGPPPPTGPPSAYWNGMVPPAPATPGPTTMPPPVMPPMQPSYTYATGQQVPPPQQHPGWGPAMQQWAAPYATPPPQMPPAPPMQPAYVSPTASQPAPGGGPPFWGHAQATPPADPYQQQRHFTAQSPVTSYPSQVTSAVSTMYTPQYVPAGAQPQGVMAVKPYTPTAEFYQPAASPYSQPPTAVAPPPEHLNGGLGPQRVAMYAQPSSQVQGYHPYRRS